jgi:hypothetical protein
MSVIMRFMNQPDLIGIPFLLWIFFLVSPFSIGFFNTPYGSRSGFFNLFIIIIILSFFCCCYCVFLFILFKLPIRSITRVLILIS